MTLTRDGLTVHAALGKDGMIHAGRIAALPSAWERRGWTIRY